MAGDIPLPPEVILFGPPAIFSTTDHYLKLLRDKFQVLNPWESPLAVDQFLRSNGRCIRAMVCGTLRKIGEEELSHLPALGVVITTSAGLDHIDLPECRRRGIAVAHAPNIFSADVADLAVGLLLDVLRRISAGNGFVKSGDWAVKSVDGPFPLATKLSHKRVGIVGLGSIGQEIARRLEPFGCKISYKSRNKKASVSYPFYTDVRELALDSDILVICCALNDQTYHLIAKQVLEALGKRGVIVNVARGAIIDERELVRFLVDGEIGGAGLDVFEDEPNVPEELFELDNVVLSSHHGVYTEESFGEMYELIVGNLDAFFSGQPLVSPVDMKE